MVNDHTSDCFRWRELGGGGAGIAIRGITTPERNDYMTESTKKHSPEAGALSIKKSKFREYAESIIWRSSWRCSSGPLWFRPSRSRPAPWRIPFGNRRPSAGEQVSSMAQSCPLAIGRFLKLRDPQRGDVMGFETPWTVPRISSSGWRRTGDEIAGRDKRVYVNGVLYQIL